MRLSGWLGRIRPRDPLARLSARSWDRICNVLETIEGVGCRVQKTLSGHGWKIIVDPAGSSDIAPPVDENGDWPSDRYEAGGPGSGSDPCVHPGSERSESDGGSGEGGGAGGESSEHPGEEDDDHPGDTDQDKHPGDGDCV